MARVDFAALGMPKLEDILLPVQIIPSNPADRTVEQAWAYDESLWQAERVLNNPTDLDLINRHHQYCTPEIFYCLYFATGNTTFRTAGNYILEVMRDPQIGFANSYDPEDMRLYCLDPTNHPGNFFQAYANPAPMGWAAYSIVNPTGEAAAARKTKDIVLYQAAAYFVKYATEVAAPSYVGAFQGARESGAVMLWVLMAIHLWGRNKTVQAMDTETSVVRTYTLGEMLDDITVAMCIDRYPAGRLGFAWDFGPGAGTVEAPTTGNMNTGGTAGEALVRLDWYLNRIGTPNAVVYNELRKWYNWLDFGTVAGLGPQAPQWHPGDTDSQHPGPGWGYYFYAHGAYGDNGSHNGNEANLNGHNLLAMAWGYARDPDATSRARYRSRVYDALAGVRKYRDRFSGVGQHVADARIWNEMLKTWSAAFGIMDWADGGSTQPPEPPTEPPEPPTGQGALREHITGWETGGQGECGGTVGTVQTSQKRSGLYALLLTSAASPVRYSFPTSALSQTTEYGKVHVRFHVTTNPSATVTYDLLALDDTAKAKGGGIRLTIAPGGQLALQAYNYQTGSVVGSSVSVPADTWMKLDLNVVMGASGMIEWRKDDTVQATATSVNTGTGNILDWATFQSPTTSGLSLDVYYDDEALDRNLYPAASRVVKVQGVSGSPTHNAWTKTGGAGIHTVWSETPASATNEAHTTGAEAKQTMVLADIVAIATNPPDTNDLLLHSWTVMSAQEIA